MKSEVLSVKQVARKLGIGINQAYEACEQNMIPCIRFGRRWIISRVAFENWLSTCGFKYPQGPLEQGRDEKNATNEATGFEEAVQ